MKKNKGRKEKGKEDKKAGYFKRKRNPILHKMGGMVSHIAQYGVSDGKSAS